ncbi:MAG: hypothetical protein H7Z71_07855 [Moraxellaceae bacterium]|nr:hypothetical protein [Pseudobdellovibrionaceae bacterium]
MTSAFDNNNKKKSNQAGFIAAEFLFSFILVISCGMVVFALTFSLMTIEVAQYITWSSARAYSAGNISKGDSEQAGRTKFNNLKAAFPLLSGSAGEWFELSSPTVGKNAGTASGMTIPDPSNRMGEETRHPWAGFSSTLELKLFKSLKLPFLGPITNDESLFKFPLHAFILRNPSQGECIQFFEDRMSAIRNLDDFKSLPSGGTYIPHEDNGC